MTDIELPSERHYEYFRQQHRLYVLFCTVYAMGAVVAVLIPGEQSDIVLIPSTTVLVFMLAIGLIWRRRFGSDHQREVKRIVSDEWTRRCMDRARRTALVTVIFAQIPLMFFMAYVPPEPSVVGMGTMSVMIACGTFAAAYLYHSRAGADG